MLLLIDIYIAYRPRSCAIAPPLYRHAANRMRFRCVVLVSAIKKDAFTAQNIINDCHELLLYRYYYSY